MLKLNYSERLSVKSDDSQTNSWEVLKQYFKQYIYPIEQVENLAHEAFQNKGGLAWQKIQFLLFDMNLRLMREGFGLGTPRFLREWELRPD